MANAVKDANSELRAQPIVMSPVFTNAERSPEYRERCGRELELAAIEFSIQLLFAITGPARSSSTREHSWRNCDDVRVLGLDGVPRDVVRASSST